MPGCATGEEAYTIGILLLEEAARQQIRPEIQVFGSDLDTGALAIAREGRFPATIEADLTEGRIRRFFSREGDHYRVRRELRDVMLFASHSLLRDPPFSRLDVISCRNLLIYLDKELQQQVCSTFCYALNPGGFLFLGSSETADQPAGLFRTIDRDARIYRSIGAVGDKRPTLPVLISSHTTEQGRPSARSPASRSIVSDATLHRQMLEKVAPPSMLVDELHRITHLSDNAGRFMQPSGGPLSVDASDLVRPELRFDLRAALHRAFERGEMTLSMPILVHFNGAAHRVYVQVKPVLQDEDPIRHALVLFIEGEPVAPVPSSADAVPVSEVPADARISQLQEELQLAHSRLRTTREELEATNEAMRAANEELQSINEEYRSTSEELEISKEELQSINEELKTVNNELKMKLETVSRAHSDLQNLMAATDMATLFLDTALRIKRFTPRLGELFNVTINDLGRSITDFTHQLDYDGLADDAGKVLRDLAPVEREVNSRDGGWYLVRIRPYRTIDDKIDGVVATFVGITERRRAEEALRESEERLRQEIRVVEVSRAPIFVWDFDGGILQWNRGSEELYGYLRDEAAGQRKGGPASHHCSGSSFEALRLALLQHGTWSGELIHRTKDGRLLTVESQIELFIGNDRRLVLESTRDITDRKRWEKRQQLLLSELTHRVKNALTVVQSLARQTLRTTGTREDLVERFEGRLSALAGAYKLLVETEWQGAELGALARGQLSAYAGRHPDRLQIEGEPILLSPDFATPFGLILHELATNAAKYGALSVDGGRVLLTWQPDQENSHRRLKVVWKETGGPQVGAPERQGFGTLLISKALPGSKVQHDFLADGVVCTIEVELPEPEGNGGD